MGNVFEGLIFATQIQHSLALNRLNEHFGEMQQRQLRAVEDQQRISALRDEIFNFNLRFNEVTQDIRQTAGLAAYWSYRFLLWVALEGVSSKSFPEYQDKMVFDKVLGRAKEILNYAAQNHYTSEEMAEIERYVFLDCGMWARSREFLNWNKILEIARRHKIVFSEWLGLWPRLMPFVLFPIFYFSGAKFFDSFVAACVYSIGLMIANAVVVLLPRQIIRKRIVDKQMSPLAKEAGGFVTEAITRTLLQQELWNLRSNIQRVWGDNLPLADHLEQLETNHAALTEEYFRAKAKYIENAPPMRAEVVRPEPPPLEGEAKA